MRCVGWLAVQNLFIVGSDKARTAFRILIIDRTTPHKLDVHPQHTHTLTHTSLQHTSRSLTHLTPLLLPLPSQLVEDPYVYPPSAIIGRLRQLLDRGGHPLESHFSFHALLGFLPLPKYHLLLVNKRHKVGSIAQRWLYGVSEWSLFPLQYRAKSAGGGAGGGGGGRTSKYRELIEGYIDLSKDFYFSYYYDLTHSLQHNLEVGRKAGGSGSGNNNGSERRESERESEREMMMDERKQKEAADDGRRDELSALSTDCQ